MLTNNYAYLASGTAELIPLTYQPSTGKSELFKSYQLCNISNHQITLLPDRHIVTQLQFGAHMILVIFMKTYG